MQSNKLENEWVNEMESINSIPFEMIIISRIACQSAHGNRMSALTTRQWICFLQFKAITFSHFHPANALCEIITFNRIVLLAEWQQRALWNNNFNEFNNTLYDRNDIEPKKGTTTTATTLTKCWCFHPWNNHQMKSFKSLSCAFSPAETQ